MDYVIQSPSAGRIRAALTDQELRVPAHFDAEVFAAVKRLARQGRVDSERAQLALLGAARLAAERVALVPLFPLAFRVRDRFGAADVFYAVLARSLSATLVTSDAALARAARGYVDVRYVSPG